MLPLFYLTQKPGQILVELADEIIRHIQQEERLSGSGFDGIDEYLIRIKPHSIGMRSLVDKLM